MISKKVKSTKFNFHQILPVYIRGAFKSQLRVPFKKHKFSYFSLTFFQMAQYIRCKEKMERKQTREGFLMNENERNAILEYEQILQGKSSRTKLSTTYFRADSNEQNHKTAVHILRYIFTKIYKWTPLDVMNKASKQMISDLKITIPYSKLIFPKEMNPKRDYFLWKNSVSGRNQIIWEIRPGSLSIQPSTPKESSVPGRVFLRAGTRRIPCRHLLTPGNH